MPWRFRREGAAQDRQDLTLEQIAAALRDGKIEPTDEVMGPGDTGWQAIENHSALAELADELEAPLPRLHEDPTSLDMNPLIDVCLVLLVFFILTTSYAAAVLKVIPLQSAGEGTKSGVRVIKADEAKKRMVEVEALTGPSGRLVVRIEGQSRDVVDADGKLDGKKLQSALQEYTKGADRKTEMLFKFRGLDWGTIVALQDNAKAAGIQNVVHALKRDTKK
jgi:biopolymer transport protein ExbD